MQLHINGKSPQAWWQLQDEAGKTRAYVPEDVDARDIVALVNGEVCAVPAHYDLRNPAEAETGAATGGDGTPTLPFEPADSAETKGTGRKRLPIIEEYQEALGDALDDCQMAQEEGAFYEGKCQGLERGLEVIEALLSERRS